MLHYGKPLASILVRILEKWEKSGASLCPSPLLSVSILTLSLVAVTKIPEHVNEYDVAGGLRGSPIEVVRAELQTSRFQPVRRSSWREKFRSTDYPPPRRALWRDTGPTWEG